MYHVPSNAWGQTLAGYDLKQHIALEAHMVSLTRIEYRHELAWETRATYQWQGIIVWESNIDTYDWGF